MKKPNVVYIYVLFDTLLNKNLYVGATILPGPRLSNHQSTTLKNYTGKENVVMNILEKSSPENAGEVEKKWTHHFVSLGIQLLKVTNNFYPKSYTENKGKVTFKTNKHGAIISMDCTPQK